VPVVGVVRGLASIPRLKEKHAGKRHRRWLRVRDFGRAVLGL
jgi:hypothetical protein